MQDVLQVRIFYCSIRGAPLTAPHNGGRMRTEEHGVSEAAGDGEDCSAPAEKTGGGRGAGKRRVRGEADAAGGAAKKKPRSVCPHQRRRSRCKECGGTDICPHQRQRSSCKECGGAGICQHQRRRSQCRECGGASLCQHQRRRSRCKECRKEADKSMPADLEELEVGDGSGDED